MVRANGTACLGTISGMEIAAGSRPAMQFNYTSPYRPSAIYITTDQRADSLISRDKIILTAQL